MRPTGAAWDELLKRLAALESRVAELEKPKPTRKAAAAEK